MQLTNSSGTVTKTYNYDAFGNEKNPSSTDTNPFRYCGEYYDTATGLYYLRARYYDPTIGRFTQEDTHRGDYKDPLSLNYYTYCCNNPIIYLDSSGNIPVRALNWLSYLYNRNIWSAQEVSVQTLISNGGNIYSAFHEIAQLNLAKHLYGLGYSPFLEYKIPSVGEADVVALNMAWEIKPLGKSGFDQLQKYLVGGNLVAGNEFLPLANIPIFGKFKMGILSSGVEPGVAHYFFYYHNKAGELCYVSSSEVKHVARTE